MFEWCLIQCWVLLFIYSGASIKKIWNREKTGKYGDDGYPGGLSKGVLYWFWTSKCVKSRCIPWGTVYFTIKEEYHLICLRRPEMAAVLFKSVLTYSTNKLESPYSMGHSGLHHWRGASSHTVSGEQRCPLFSWTSETETFQLTNKLKFLDFVHKLQAFFFEKIWRSLFFGLSLSLSVIFVACYWLDWDEICLKYKKTYGTEFMLFCILKSTFIPTLI